jgi:hypothetical protein
MRSVHHLFSAVQFIFTTLILLIGGFFVGLHYAPHLRFSIGQFFVESSAYFIPIGLSILGCGLLLLFGFYAMNRGAYFRFIVPVANTIVEAALIRACVKKYWLDQFPQSALATDVIVHPGQLLEISLQLPSLGTEDQQPFLEKIEKDLGSLLSRSLGYRRDFLLTLIVIPQSGTKLEFRLRQSPAVQR